MDWLDLSPKYWAGSGLPNSPSMNNTNYTNYIYNNSTALVMRRNDWSYASYLNVEGYYEVIVRITQYQSRAPILTDITMILTLLIVKTVLW